MSERTSANQIRQFSHCLWKFICTLGRHLSRRRGIYGFLAGWTSAILMLAAVFWYGIMAFPLPWKVIDPADPRFDVKAFKFTDYDQGDGISEAMCKLFPVGTDKASVDRVLVKIGGAREEKNTGEDPYFGNKESIRVYYIYWHLRSLIYAYRAMMPGSDFDWEVYVIYSKDLKVERVIVIGNVGRECNDF